MLGHRGNRSFRPKGAETERRQPGLWTRLTGRLLGIREIDKLVDENFPSWQEYSTRKLHEADQARQEEQFELPPHKVAISSPLQRNFLYFLVVSGALGLGYAVPEWAPMLLYGAIFFAFAIALLTLVRDGVFFHIESQRLGVDGDMINKHAQGPGDEQDEKPTGFLKSFTRKKKTIFRSRLLQIHYQNVLRTFEQGNRRAWVYQDASIGEIQTLLSQRGMKLVWTVIEVLPQLGLLGTLIGLVTMFLAFRSTVEAPELAVISGFGTALGTTILANLFVLILRPLYMQNERSMNEILSTLQTLMAIFILPTQQHAMERGYRGAQLHTTAAAVPPSPLHGGINETRLNRTLEELTLAIRDYVSTHERVNDGSLARETAKITHEVQSALRAFREAINPDQLQIQQRALHLLTRSVQELGSRLTAPQPAETPQQTERIEHDLTQLRVLTRDTLLLLEQIAERLGKMPGGTENLLSIHPDVRAQVFPDSDEPEAGSGPDTPATEPDRAGMAAPRIRLVKERK